MRIHHGPGIQILALAGADANRCRHAGGAAARASQSLSGFCAVRLSAHRASCGRQTRQSAALARLRQILVTGQFAILIGLIIAPRDVSADRLRDPAGSAFDTDQMLLIQFPCDLQGWHSSELRRLSGVRGVSCSGFPTLFRTLTHQRLAPQNDRSEPFSLHVDLPNRRGALLRRSVCSAHSSPWQVGPWEVPEVTYYVSSMKLRLGAWDLPSPLDAIGYEVPVYDANPPSSRQSLACPGFLVRFSGAKIEAPAFDVYRTTPGSI